MELTQRTREERARAIRAARAAARLKQMDVASRAGLDQATVSKAERGRGSETTYDAIEAALGVTGSAA